MAVNGSKAGRHDSVEHCPGIQAGVGFSLLYRIRRISDGLVLAKVQTGMVCFDYGKQRVCRLPSALKTALEAV